MPIVLDYVPEHGGIVGGSFYSFPPDGVLENGEWQVVIPNAVYARQVHVVNPAVQPQGWLAAIGNGQMGVIPHGGQGGAYAGPGASAGQTAFLQGAQDVVRGGEGLVHTLPQQPLQTVAHAADDAGHVGFLRGAPGMGREAREQVGASLLGAQSVAHFDEEQIDVPTQPEQQVFNGAGGAVQAAQEATTVPYGPPHPHQQPGPTHEQPEAPTPKPPAPATRRNRAASPKPAKSRSQKRKRSLVVVLPIAVHIEGTSKHATIANTRLADPENTPLAAETPHVGPLFPTRRDILLRADEPYICNLCGNGFAHPDDVRAHFAGVCWTANGALDGVSWDAHESLRCAWRGQRCRDGWVLRDQASWDDIEAAVAAGRRFKTGGLGMDGAGVERVVDPVMEATQAQLQPQPQPQPPKRKVVRAGDETETDVGGRRR